MMKKTIILSLVFGLFITISSLAFAQPGPRGHHFAPPPPPPPAPRHYEMMPPPPPGPHMMPPPPSPESEPMAISPYEFDRLVQTLRRGGPHTNRVAIIRQAASYHWFTCGQLRILMEQLMMEEERVEAACSVQHRVLDPYYFRELHNALGDPRSHQMLDACWHR